MKRLPYSKINCIDIFDQIIKNKTEPNRQNLKALRRKVKHLYRKYIRFINNLEFIEKSAISVKSNRDLLCSCYQTKTIGLDKLKKLIKDTIRPPRCPYCNINEAKTLDHYLPKESFPEFAVLYWNLIPCCHECNIKKGEQFLDGKTRKFVYFPKDSIPNTPVFIVSLIFQPSLNFAITSSQNLPPVWKNHVDILKLCARYKSAYSPTFEIIIDNIQTSRQDGLSDMIIRRNLLRSYGSIVKKQGIHNIEGLLYKLCADNLSLIR